MGEYGWSSELRQVASGGEAHLRPPGECRREGEGLWRALCDGLVMLGRGEGPFVGGVHCEGL